MLRPEAGLRVLTRGTTNVTTANDPACDRRARAVRWHRPEIRRSVDSSSPAAGPGAPETPTDGRRGRHRRLPLMMTRPSRLLSDAWQWRVCDSSLLVIGSVMAIDLP